MNENTVHYSATGRYAVEIKRNNGDGTFSTVLFRRDGDGGLNFMCGEFHTPIEIIRKWLDDSVDFSTDRE